MVTAKDTTFLYEPQVELQMLIQSTRTKEIPTIMNYIWQTRSLPFLGHISGLLFARIERSSTVEMFTFTI